MCAEETITGHEREIPKNSERGRRWRSIKKKEKVWGEREEEPDRRYLFTKGRWGKREKTNEPQNDKRKN